MPKPTFHNLPIEKRAHITQVAIDEFVAHTYAGASISRMVASAGIAKGSFYQYFDGKADLYRWLLYDEVGRRKFEHLKHAGSPPQGDWWASFAHLMWAGIRFGLDNPELSRLSLSAWYPSSDPDLHALHVEMLATGRNNMKILLQQGQAAGHVREDIDLDLSAELFMAVLRQGLDLAVERKVGVDLLTFCSHPELAERFPDEEQIAMINEIVDMLRRALGTGERGPEDGGAIDLGEWINTPWGPSS